MNEVWKRVVGYESYYEISNLGNVRSFDRLIHCKAGGYYVKKGRMLKQYDDKGYKSVILTVNKIAKTFKIHQLVAMAFIPNPDNLPEINHKDENKINNNVSNLEWCTKKYNMNYGSRNERAGKAISNALKGKYVGENSFRKGKHHSESAKLKNRLAHLGKKHSEDSKRKISEGVIKHFKRKGGRE